MKWSIAVLAVLGVIAAACAAMLFLAVRHSGNKPGAKEVPTEVEVVRAARAIRAMEVVNASCVYTEKMSVSEVPPDFVSSAALVIGKVMATPMVDKQVFTKACFVTEGSGPRVAAAVPDGMRAVTLRLSTSAGLENLLYPGGVVDVIASVTVSDDNRQSKREVVSTALLQAVQVLAVGPWTILTSEENTGTKPNSTRSTFRLVTLLVTPDQARALQLIKAERGSLNLTMRNPLDQETVQENPMSIRKILGRSRRKPAAPAVTEVKVAEFSSNPKDLSDPAIEWEVMVLRGGAATKQSFNIAE